MKTLYSPYSSPEAIVAWGADGGGKTDAALQWAKACPDMHVEALQCDHNRALEYMLEHNTRFNDGQVGNVNVASVDPYEWEDWPDAIDEVVKRCPKGGLIILDALDTGWGAVQADYLYKDRGLDTEEYYQAVRDNRRENGMNQLTEWPVVNSRWAKVVWKPLRRRKGHIIITCGEKKLGEKEDARTRAQYGAFGVKPAGPNQMAHWPHASLRFVPTRGMEEPPEMFTAKDRSGKEFGGTMRSFPLQYLKGVVGWKFAETETGEADG